MTTEPHILAEMRHITKRFPGVVANDDVSLVIRRGEIHTVLGENGAGKSTLMNILSGMLQPDEGESLIRGERVELESPQEALQRGIGTVYQHFTLVPTLTVIENVVLGTKAGFVLDLKRAERKLKEMLGDFEMTIPVDTEVRHLSIGQQQRVEIIKVLFRGTEILLLDEPTSVLTPLEVKELFRVLLRLREQGVAVVFITHKLNEALEVSDRITILRDGQHVGEITPEDLATASSDAITQQIVERMFGGAPPAMTSNGRKHTPSSDVTLALQQVTALGDRGTPAVHDVTLDFYAGEIFGIAGVDGNGQKELGEVIAGQRRVVAGRVLVDGVDVTNRGIAAAEKVGIGYITDDRMGEGSVSSLSVAENTVLKTIDKMPFSHWSLINHGAIRAHAHKLIKEFDIKTPGTRAPIGTLSGGNVQKLLLARELALSPRVLVCNKPTQGLDLKTARFVLQTLQEQADQGTTVILISSELDEILEVSDRLGVIYNGQILDVRTRDDADPETIGRLMLGLQS